jgi:transcriptional antiterminator NusG
MNSTASWVALVVRPRAERNVQAGLTNAGLETFVPWHGVRRRWSDRIKVLQQNLFPGYIFCRSTFAERLLVMTQPGVEHVVTFDRSPALIPEEEIASLRRVIASGLPLGPWPFLKAGDRVRIERGVLAGMEGTLARDSDAWRIVVSVNALQRAVAVEVDRDTISPIRTFCPAKRSPVETIRPI